MLVHNIGAGVSTKGLCFWVSAIMSIFSKSVVGMKRTSCFAPDFIASCTSVAVQARVNHATYTYIVTYLHSGHLGSYFNYGTDEFMTWHNWVRGSCEMVQPQVAI